MGMNSLKTFCKEKVWSDDENRLLHVEFLRTQNQKILSVTDLYHCVWFFDIKYKNKKDDKEKKAYIKNVQRRGLHAEKKVAILDCDIVTIALGHTNCPRV